MGKKPGCLSMRSRVRTRGIPTCPSPKNPLPMPLPAFVVGTDDAKGRDRERVKRTGTLADELLTSAKKHFPRTTK